LFQAFEELLQHVESDSIEARELFDAMISGLTSIAEANLDTATHMTFKLLTSKKMDFSAFEQHPLKRVIDLHNMTDEENYCGLLQHLLLLYPTITDIPFTVLVNLADEPERHVVLDKFNIPGTVQLGQIGYYYYSKSLLQATDVTAMFLGQGHRCCNIFESLMLSYSRNGRKEVLNPLVLLVLNSFQSCDIGTTLTLHGLSDSVVERIYRTIMTDIEGTKVEHYFNTFLLSI
jgi:hypothetical protein